MTRDTVEDVPVLFSGGGLVGLSTAMFLAQHGISSVAVERLRGGSPVPRAAFFHMRTLEMFRSAGIEDQVREQSSKEFEPEGAIVLMDTLAGKVLAGLIPSLNEGVEALSPCRRLFVTQPGLEPILRARAEQAGASVIEGHEVVEVANEVLAPVAEPGHCHVHSFQTLSESRPLSPVAFRRSTTRSAWSTSAA